MPLDIHIFAYVYIVYIYILCNDQLLLLCSIMYTHESPSMHIFISKTKALHGLGAEIGPDPSASVVEVKGVPFLRELVGVLVSGMDGPAGRRQAMLSLARKEVCVQRQCFLFPHRERQMPFRNTRELADVAPGNTWDKDAKDGWSPSNKQEPPPSDSKSHQVTPAEHSWPAKPLIWSDNRR